MVLDNIKEYMYFKLVCIITKMGVWLKWFVGLFVNTNITEIKAIKINNTLIDSITLKYYIIKFINKYVNFLHKCTKYIIFIYDKIGIPFVQYYIRVLKFAKKIVCSVRNMFDINIKKIQFTKHYDNGLKKIILNTKTKMKIIDIVRYIGQTNGYVDKINPIIFLKFELHNGNNIVCLKKFRTQYKDTLGSYNNTLANILQFNNIVVEDTAYLRLSKFKDGSMVIKDIPYDDVADVYINDIDITNDN